MRLRDVVCENLLGGSDVQYVEYCLGVLDGFFSWGTHGTTYGKRAFLHV